MQCEGRRGRVRKIAYTVRMTDCSAAAYLAAHAALACRLCMRPDWRSVGRSL